ncbi:MAG: hypothetical protein K0R54_3852 [Clostridiaceae bacterium]|nr:hypothetical protein [Clostridiaceae bacterium]
MEYYQKVIIDILNASVNNKNIVFNEENGIDWNEVIREAKQHKISSLIYSAVDKDSLKYIDDNILAEWKKDIFKDNVTQIRHINNISQLVNNLNKQGIEIILLKGLVLRELYPRPEYRTMSDADILVKSKDYLVLEDHLIKNGYECDKENHPVHKCFMCSDHSLIEVHWKLINDSYFNGYTEKFENDVWKKSIEFNISGAKCKTLCDEDLLIHMCLHMAVHAKYRGFGLRQLYDVAIFVKNKNIDWVSFCSRISVYGISKFTKGIFEILNQIFDLNIPKDILKNQYISQQEIQLLLNNILASGVHGQKEEIVGFNISYKDRSDESYSKYNVKRLFKFIFPTRAELSYRYEYAKENVLLLPIAWIHHAIRGVFIRKYGFVKMIKYYLATLDVINRRKEIIKIFEL